MNDPRYVTAIISGCIQHTPSNPGDPHLHYPLFPRQDGKPHDPAFLWCLGYYDQQRQNRRVCIETRGSVQTMVGEGLTVAGSALREPYQPNSDADGCGECTEPEDFDWDFLIEFDRTAPVIACFRHKALAPGWLYGPEVEPGLLAYRNPVVLRSEAKA